MKMKIMAYYSSLQTLGLQTTLLKTTLGASAGCRIISCLGCTGQEMTRGGWSSSCLAHPMTYSFLYCEFENYQCIASEWGLRRRKRQRQPRKHGSWEGMEWKMGREGKGGEGRGREGKRERQKGGRKDCVLHDVDHLVACSALSYDNQKCFQTAKSLSWVVKISPCWESPAYTKEAVKNKKSKLERSWNPLTM